MFGGSSHIDGTHEGNRAALVAPLAIPWAGNLVTWAGTRRVAVVFSAAAARRNLSPISRQLRQTVFNRCLADLTYLEGGEFLLRRDARVRAHLFAMLSPLLRKNLEDMPIFAFLEAALFLYPARTARYEYRPGRTM